MLTEMIKRLIKNNGKGRVKITVMSHEKVATRTFTDFGDDDGTLFSFKCISLISITRQ